MEDSMKKFALIAMLVVIAVVLVTCDMLVPPEATEEWTDVEYQIEGVVGQERVKSVKLYLQPDGMDRSVLPGPNTYGVRVSPEQKRIIRALTADTAAASHDFFEAVFVAVPGNVVRTNWEIGYPAGVSGGLLTKTTGYQNIPTVTATTAPTSSTVFVGRKQNKTLLGVGFMTDTEGDTPVVVGSITNNTFAVTYTIAPIKTWLGFDATMAGDPPVPTSWTLRERTSAYGDEVGAGVATFTTANGPTPPAGEPNYGVGTAFKPIPGSTVYYPLFRRPSTTGGNITNFTGTYTIGGLTGVPGGPNAGSLLGAIRVYGAWGGTPRGGMQVIKRKPAFLFNGRTYQAGSLYDDKTQLLGGTAASGTIPGTAQNQGGATYVSSAFTNVITVGFTITNQSSGVFAITFQCPVYAITTAVNTAEPTVLNPYIKWWVRPADGPNLYLLDSGLDEGGMVMIGDTNAFSDDWIEIKTTGIGFQNN